VRDIRPLRGGQSIKEVRTYSIKKDHSGEITLAKTDVNESISAISESGGDEKDESLESEDKENVKEPTEEATESLKPDKENEEKSSVSIEVLLL
jgi:hypothetical protein